MEPTKVSTPSPFGPMAEEERLDLRTYWRMVVRWWWILVLGTLAAGTAAFFISGAQTPLYDATTRILVQGSRTPGTPSAGDIQASQQLAQSYVDLVTTRSILQQVAEALGMPVDTVGLGGKISVRSPRSFILITANDPNPGTAADIANTTARVFIDDFQRRQFTQIAQFQASLSQYGILEDPAIIAAQAATLTTLSIIEDAIPPPSPSTPRLRRNVLLAAIVGLLMAGLIVILREYLDDRVRSPEELRDLTGIRNLAGMPTMGSVVRFRSHSDARPLIIKDQPAQSLTEAYRFLQTNLEFAAVGTSGLKSLLVTSSSPEEGKTTTAVNLAISMARDGKRVLLVDTDLRRPAMHRLFDLQEQKGLTHLLLGNGTIEEVSGRTEIAGLRVIPAGPPPPDPPQVLRSSRMRELVAEIKENAEFVIFDSPPLLAVTDPMLMVPLVDGVLLVVDAERTRRGPVRRSVEMLQLANPQVVGAVLNKVSARAGGYGSYYYYHDNHYAEADSAESDGSRRRFISRSLSRLRFRKSGASKSTDGHGDSARSAVRNEEPGAD